MRDLHKLDKNQLISEVLSYKNQVAKLEVEKEELQRVVKPLEKAFVELLELAVDHRERLGLDTVYFESDWMEKANLL